VSTLSLSPVRRRRRKAALHHVLCRSCLALPSDGGRIIDRFAILLKHPHRRMELLQASELPIAQTVHKRSTWHTWSAPCNGGGFSPALLSRSSRFPRHSPSSGAASRRLRFTAAAAGGSTDAARGLRRAVSGLTLRCRAVDTARLGRRLSIGVRHGRPLPDRAICAGRVRWRPQTHVRLRAPSCGQRGTNYMMWRVRRCATLAPGLDVI